MGRPWRRLGFGIVMAPASATLIVAAIAFVVAGMSEATQIGTLVVTLDATVVFLYFVAVLMVTSVAPSLVILMLFGWRSGLVWAMMGALAGIATAYAIAEARGTPMMPAVPIGALTAAYLMTVLRWVAGIRRRPIEMDPEDPRYVV
ncbi:MAG: hypothetical protein AAF577_07385 [Pseudomonadota bacterium]